MNISGIPISNLDPKLEVEGFGDFFAKMLGVPKEVAESTLGVIQKAFDAAKEHWLNEACKWLDENADKYVFEGIADKPYVSVAFVDDFRKHMEGSLNEVKHGSAGNCY